MFIFLQVSKFALLAPQLHGRCGLSLPRWQAMLIDKVVFAVEAAVLHSRLDTSVKMATPNARGILNGIRPEGLSSISKASYYILLFSGGLICRHGMVRDTIGRKTSQRHSRQTLDLRDLLR
jgi:hypothetical protein